jgi:predicted dinucleotide-binding enzyme
MRIGIIGAGMIGSTLSKLWVDAGHDVRLASRHPDNLLPLIQKLGRRASTGTPAESAQFGDVVLLAVPLKAVPSLARDLAHALMGKVVVDTGNAYALRDGQAAREATGHPSGSAGWAAAMFSGTQWVKGFNTVNPRCSSGRRTATTTAWAFRSPEIVKRRWNSSPNSYATPASIQSSSALSRAERSSSLTQPPTTLA